MENWQKGDTAICVNNGRLPTTGKGEIPLLRIDTQYIVNNVKVCECGKITLDVGLSLRGDVTKGVQCECGAVSSHKTGIHWCDSARFVKPKTDTSTAEESLEKQLGDAVAVGDEEKINELLDKLNN